MAQSIQRLDLDNQQLSLAGNDLSISKGNTLTLPFANYLPIIGGTLSGTTGNGFLGLLSQSATPSTPTSGFKLYANSSNALSWIGSNGFTRTFDGTNNTANRTYTLQNSSGTIPLLEATQTWSGTNTFTANENYFKIINISENSNSYLKLGQFSVAYPNALIDATTSGSSIILRTQGSDKFKLFNNGNLVLQNGGTFTDTGEKLQINGTSRFSGASVFSKGSAGEIIRLSGAAGGHISYTVSGDINFILTGANMTFDGTNFSTIYTDRYGVFSRFSPATGTSTIAYQLGLLDTGTNPRTPVYPFTLLNNGNVGIGTVAPLTKLVVSNSGAEGFEVNPNGSNISLTSYNRSTSTYAAFRSISNSFLWQVGTSPVDKMILDTNGNLGIGATTPTSKLQVVGSQAGTILSVATATTLAEQRWIIVTSGVLITLPTASTCTGRIYTINARAIGVTISSYLDLLGTVLTTIANGISIDVVSDGTNWQQVR